MKNEEIEPTTDRERLISEYLLRHSITSILGAPDELLEAAGRYADGILGVGNDDAGAERPDPATDDLDEGFAGAMADPKA